MKKAVTLYTDGSKTQKDTGAGVWRARPRASFSISLAHARCARINVKRGYKGKTINMYSNNVVLDIPEPTKENRYPEGLAGKKCLAGIMVIDSGLVEIVHLQLLSTLNNTGCGMSSSLPSKPTSYHNTRRTQTSFR
ncbi:hypothetical protein J6590_083557 [Homalodisca vitripennis]|nr:hypothetical protein J6590_083557 [Homalodisca vitripennis]